MCSVLHMCGFVSGPYKVSGRLFFNTTLPHIRQSNFYNGEYIRGQPMVEKLALSFYTHNVKIEVTPRSWKIPNKCRTNNDKRITIIIVEITSKELQDGFKAMTKEKTPCIDGIPVKFFQNC